MKIINIMKLEGAKSFLKKIKDLPKEVFLYILYGIFCLFLFVYIRFPYQKIQDNLLVKLQESLSLNISVKEMAFRFPLGFKWKDIKMSKAENLSQKSPFKIDEIKIRLGIIPLLAFKKNIYINGKAFGGEIEGSVQVRDNDYWVSEKTLKELELSKIYSPESSKRSKLSGKVNSSLNFYMPQGTFSLSNGSFLIELKDLNIENFWLMIPKISLSEIKGEIKLLKGRGYIKTFEGKGDDIRITGRGTFDLANSLMDSKINITLKVTPNGEKSVFGKIISALAKSKGRSFVPVAITGNLSKPFLSVFGQPLQ